ncbi:DUF2218 domain-containing protein [Planktotalea sp.]|uniref:DUF2218 domain-containing protein n=1 Tax=Planktotalea sp. TaxID=2029877 RepID=UPI003298F8FC
MTTINGYYETKNASKYLQQLCKHFGNKVEASFDADKGWVAFIMGTVHLSADSEGLTAVCDVKDEASVQSVHHVIDSHLARFAFREEFKSMNWTQEPS